jgi:hypothetical protein
VPIAISLLHFTLRAPIIGGNPHVLRSPPLPPDFSPVEGHSIKETYLASCAFVVGGVLIAAFGAGWTYWRWTLDRISFWGIIITAAGVFGLIVGSFSVARSRRKLVIGKDRFQLLTKDEKVLIEVPYANIARVAAVHNSPYHFVAVILEDPEVPATKTGDTLKVIEATVKHSGCHIKLDQSFTETPEAISDRINEAMAANNKGV